MAENIGKEKKRGKIINLLILTMLIVGTIPLIISGYNLVSYNANILATDQQLMHLQICKSVASEISLFLKSCLNILIPLEKELELGFDPAQPKQIFIDEKTKSLLRGIFEAHNRIINIRVLYADGQGSESGYSIKPEEDPELSEELRNTFYRCMKTEFLHISRPYYSDTFNQTMFVIGKTLLVNNEVQGVVTVVFSMEDVQNSIRRASQSRNTAFVLDSKGNIILHPDIRMIRAGINLSASPIFTELRKLRTHAISTIPFTDTTGGNSVEMMGTVYMIPESNVGWGIVVQTPEEVVNVVIQNMRRQTIYWILLSLVLALLMSFFFSQRISTPILQLTEKTLSIAKGKFEERVNISSNNELGILATNFNQMAEEIQDRIKLLQQAAEENRALFMNAIKTLAAAIDAKDPYTHGHSERVTKYAVKIARNMGLSKEEIENIKIAALLHDVGKIGISDAILQKPSQLTEEEYAIMKQHPVLGGNIMNQIPQLREIIPGMNYHHESLDGSGYPLGLKGDEIPMSARIIGVAAAFDAMTTERPYQKPFTHAEAMEKIRSMAGRKFDFQVVEALAKENSNGGESDEAQAVSATAGRQVQNHAVH